MVQIKTTPNSMSQRRSSFEKLDSFRDQDSHKFRKVVSERQAQQDGGAFL